MLDDMLVVLKNIPITEVGLALDYYGLRFSKKVFAQNQENNVFFTYLSPPWVSCTVVRCVKSLFSLHCCVENYSMCRTADQANDPKK